MADKIAFAVFDSTGAPKTDALASGMAMTIYRTRTGTIVSAPAITHLGGGVYGFEPTDGDVTGGISYMITTGTGGFPSRLAGSVYGDGGAFATILLVDAIDALWTGAAPTLPIYKGFNGLDLLPKPSLVPVAGAYLYSLTPSPTDLTAGVAYRVDAPASAYPTYVTGSFYDPTIVTVIPPTSGLYDGAFAIPFTAVAQAPTIISAEALTGTSLRVIFSESVMDVDALIPANYIITMGGGLSVYSVTKEADRFYILTTSDQTPGQTYTVTAYNIRDQKSNPV